MGRYNRQQDNSGNGLWAGVIVLCIGLFFFLDRLDLHLPHWVFSWPMLLIVIGFVMSAKRKFQGPSGLILMFMGTLFLVDDIVPFTWDLRRFLWPVIMIVIGIYLIGKASSRKRQYDEYIQGGSTSEDYLQATTIFSGSNKVVLSKDFKGGNITTMFGGTELNFMQADINGEAVLDITTLFGGVEIMVPSSWDVKLDVNTVFGGIEDKRAIGVAPMPGKRLLIKGSCTFGGVDLKSY